MNNAKFLTIAFIKENLGWLLLSDSSLGDVSDVIKYSCNFASIITKKQSTDFVAVTASDLQLY